MDEKEKQVESLLARGYLSGAQYDEIERRVLERTAAKPRASLRLLAPAAVGVVGLAAGVALWLRAPPKFTAKGEPAAELGAVEISCNRPARHECRLGDTMAFMVNSAVASGYLGAYALRVGAPTHERIWYFPSLGEAGPVVARGAGTVVLPEGVRVGPEHQRGRYLVTVWLSKKPLLRSEVDLAEPSAFAVYSKTTIEVVP